jgi:hypothetical protein
MKVLLHIDEFVSLVSRLITVVADFLSNIAFPSSGMISMWHDSKNKNDVSEIWEDIGVKSKKKPVTIEEYLISQGYMTSIKKCEKHGDDEIQPELKEEKFMDDALN